MLTASNEQYAIVRSIAAGATGCLQKYSGKEQLLTTLREVEILNQFAAGLSYQEIGDVREISALTVRNAVSGVQKKLGFRTRQQMVVWAIRAGVVDVVSA